MDIYALHGKEVSSLCNKMIYLVHRIKKSKNKKARWLKAYKRLEEKSYNIIISD